MSYVYTFQKGEVDVLPVVGEGKKNINIPLRQTTTSYMFYVFKVSFIGSQSVDHSQADCILCAIELDEIFRMQYTMCMMMRGDRRSGK